MKKRKKLGRKLLSFLITLAMVVGLMPGMRLTALADATLSNLWIGNSGEITSEGVVNDTGGTGTASVAVDGDDIVITLTDFSYSGAGNSYSNFLSGITYIGDYNLRVELVGNNTITQTGNNGGNCAGFYTFKSGSSVSFCGSGSLIVSGGNAQSNSFGISVGGPLSIEECTIIATSGNATQYASKGIAAGGDINVFNADVTASCGTTSGSSYCNGIEAFSYISGPHNLVIMSGNVKATGTSSALYYGSDSFRTQMILSDGHGRVLSLQAGENEAGATDVTVENVANQKYVSIKTERILHTHDFTYTATGATITATCTADGCTLPESSAGAGDNVATLTIAANGGTYDGTTAYGATITDANSIQGDAKVQYQKKTDGSYGTATETAPTDAGEYKASITVGGATASVEYTIAQADPTATAPTGLTATYGQTLADVSLEGKNPEGNTPGTWAWADSTKSVGNVVDPAATFKANFTPTSSNYKTVENVDVTVTVGKADPTAPTSLTATYGQTLANVTLPDGWTWADSTQSVGNVVDPAATFKANFAGDDNHNAASNVDVTVTVGKANTVAATVTANNRTYDGTEKPLVTVTGEATGGEMQYALGTATEATQPYTTDIPAKTDAGTYYVWYKVKADENHVDSEAVSVKVTIAKKKITVTAEAKSITEGDKDVALTYKTDGLVAGDTADKVLSGALTRETGTTAGTYKITQGTLKASDNYDITFVGADYVIAKAPEQKQQVVTPEPVKENKAELALNAGLKISQTGSKINIKWGKVKEADGYNVYVTYCGTDFGKPTWVAVKNTKTKVSITKIKGKKINLTKNFKVYVEAYKKVNGKKEILAKTITGHVVGRKNNKYSNAKKITLAQSEYTVEVGKTETIKAKTVLVYKGKKQLSDDHAKEFRYASSDESIAKVSASGTITGVAKGTCTVYVYARNGYAKKVSVTIK